MRRSSELKFDSVSTGGDSPQAAVLLIYTGGTIGMVKDSSGTLTTFDFANIQTRLPSLKTFDIQLDVISFLDPIDSSSINVDDWLNIGQIIFDNYGTYDGFVVLSGTDTMAYTASALSFILPRLNKPVIFTGAQLPISDRRTDAHENLITALEIAATKVNNAPVVSEVCIFFDYKLLRGNRSRKVESVAFDAFKSYNYPELAEAGVSIDYNHQFIKPHFEETNIQIQKAFDNRVAILKVFPGISEAVVRGVLEVPDLKGVVLETFGSGNGPNEPWFYAALEKAIAQGVVIFNVSQCYGGRIMPGRYQSGKLLQDMGVVNGRDITTEAALAKMMFLLGKYEEASEVKRLLSIPFVGEMASL